MQTERRFGTRYIPVSDYGHDYAFDHDSNVEVLEIQYSADEQAYVVLFAWNEVVPEDRK